ncbi:DUF4225 domain-containing protein [Cronobacter turicensis]|nr:DUF4225 domain-containing protein [Cronobacter turicensis]
MDIFIPGQPRFRNYFLTMASAEVNVLMNTAFMVSSSHLKDALTRIRFQNDIRNFAKRNLDIIRISTDDKECQACIQSIREQKNSLLIQDRMLRTGEAALTASIRFYHENEKIIGYIINGIGIVLGGVQIITGVGLALGGGGIGIIAGAHLVLSGTAAIVESVQKLNNNPKPVNFMKDIYMDSAQFLGFDKTIGLLAYQTVDLTTSFYGAFRLTVNPESWMLFKHMPGDYYRKVDSMSRNALVIEGIKSGYKGYQIGNSLFGAHEK